ncbi:MAG: TRAP transporter large permease [candidate division NC10 bacterium]|nr:TRAP transporter large permease [candidate division NC10 bacterium]
MDIAIDLIILIGFLALGVPVPFCFMAAVLFLVVVHGYSFEFLLPIAFYSLNSLTLLSVPFFIMAGGLMGSSGLAERLANIATARVGRFRGGLGGATVVACAIFGAIAGLCSAAVAAIGSIMIPRMEREGYPRGHATGLVTCASVLAQLIPPSVPMILFAWVTRLSVAAAFLSTIGPGILLVVIYIFLNWLMCRRIPTIKVRPRVGLWQQAKEVGDATIRGILALVGALIILGGIYGGFTTPTEAATLAVVYTIFVGLLVYRSLTFRELGRTLFTTATTTGVIILMLFFVMMLSRIYTMENVPQRLIQFMTGISENKYVILAMVNVFLIIIGMLMDDFSGTLLSAPLLLPLIKHIGVNPYHFAAIMGTNLGLGNVTPPCAPILYLGGRMANCSFDKYIKPALIFMVFGSLPVVIITTYWPGLSLFLPRLIMGIE